MRWMGYVTLATLVILPIGAGVLHADEQEAETASLRMRVFHVGGLTHGLQSFVRAVGPTEFDVHADQSPLFGAEVEDRWYPVGMSDELTEYVRSFVEPAFWENAEGADINALGEHGLLVRATPEVLDKVGVFLAQLEQRILTNVKVEMHAVRLTPETLSRVSADGGLDDATVATLLDTSGPGLTITAYPGQRAAVHTGHQRAYVSSYWSRVAEGAQISGPAISVANLGLIAEVVPELSDDGKTIRLGISGVMTQMDEPRRLDTGAGRSVEVPAFDVFTCRTDTLTQPGKWQLLQGRASSSAEPTPWFLLVRADIGRHVGAPTETARLNLGGGPVNDSGMLEPRVISTRMLARPPIPSAGSGAYLLPSEFIRPEPPELPEPEPVVWPEAVLELVVAATGWDAWESGGSIEARNGMLLVRNTPGVLRAVDETVSRLRRQLLWSVETTAEVIVVPSEVARRLGAERGSGGTLLDDAGRTALDEALEAGDARRLDTARVRNFNGVRNTVTSGREVAYVNDYRGEITKGASTGSPLVHRCLSGIELDVTGRILSTGDAASLEVRFLRTHLHEPMRTMLTPLGSIETPTLDVLRLRTSLTVPFGKTAVLGAGGKGGEEVIVLVTPTLSGHD